MSVNFQPLANFIWSVADLLRGPYRPPQYERVMLPLTVLRPLRLRFQITRERCERFLDACPELFDALQAVQDALGTEPLLD
jgi:type I restriction enzyme M protein